MGNETKDDNASADKRPVPLPPTSADLDRLLAQLAETRKEHERLRKEHDELIARLEGAKAGKEKRCWRCEDKAQPCWRCRE